MKLRCFVVAVVAFAAIPASQVKAVKIATATSQADLTQELELSESYTDIEKCCEDAKAPTVCYPSAFAPPSGCAPATSCPKATCPSEPTVKSCEEPEPKHACSDDSFDATIKAILQKDHICDQDVEKVMDLTTVKPCDCPQTI